jgi:hypothetical protein
MCSYPCFGLSKTGFTPPSQLLKLVILFYIKKKTKTVSLPMQESTSKTASLLIQESAAKTESSIIYIYIYIYFFWVLTIIDHKTAKSSRARVKQKI